MASATIPVDLRNPGQVFACLGLMEVTEILCGECEGAFGYKSTETQTAFSLSVLGAGEPVAAALRFLVQARAMAIVPAGSSLSTEKWDVPTQVQKGSAFPCPEPDTPASLPVILTDGQHSIPIEHWV